MTRLDVRQDSRRYQEVLTDILRAIGKCDDFAALDVPAQCQLLAETIDYAGPIRARACSRSLATRSIFTRFWSGCQSASAAPRWAAT